MRTKEEIEKEVIDRIGEEGLTKLAKDLNLAKGYLLSNVVGSILMKDSTKESDIDFTLWRDNLVIPEQFEDLTEGYEGGMLTPYETYIGETKINLLVLETITDFLAYKNLFYLSGFLELDKKKRRLLFQAVTLYDGVFGVEEYAKVTTISNLL